ncbi:MAG: hypothetical protein IJQ81_03770 [Oscillibacter sp.]|nr:hypothetical protein [Oscillibacter sp.]
MKRNGFSQQDFTLDSFLNLMENYREEWKFRSELHWKLNFKFFYADIVVLFLPNISTTLGINLSKFPSVIFPIVAAILSLIFLYFSIGVAKRVEASAKTYSKLIKSLPPNLQRVSILSSDIKRGKYFNVTLDPALCYAMFLSLFVLSIVMIVYHLNA